MRVTIDGVELPADVEAELVMSERPQVSLRVPASSSLVSVLAGYADGKPRVIQWWNGDVLVAEAHANLYGRLVARSGGRPEAAVYELWGQAWGRPPGYSQFIMGVASSGTTGTGEPASPTPSGTA